MEGWSRRCRGVRFLGLSLPKKVNRDARVSGRPLQSLKRSVPVSGGESDVRVGLGHDTHRLAEGRPLILGGVADRTSPRPGRAFRCRRRAPRASPTPCSAPPGWAISASITPTPIPHGKGSTAPGSSARSSPGSQGPGWRPVNCDVIIHAQEPKLGPYKPALRANLARLLGLDPGGRQCQGQDRRACRTRRPGEAICLRGHRPGRTGFVMSSMIL